MRFCVLVSGTGTNLQALIDSRDHGDLSPAELALVVSNKPQCKALQRAEEAGIEISTLSHQDYSDRNTYDLALIELLKASRIDAVVLAGFMRILGPAFIAQFPDRILNTHPALCPAFPGLHAPAQAIDAGVRVSGCTVHLVDEGVDTGPIVFQASVTVEPDDTPQSLHRKIQSHEHRLLPVATRLLAAGALIRKGKGIRILPTKGAVAE